MQFSTKDWAWSNVSLMLLGRKVTGLRGFELKKTVEKEHIYAAGDEPIDIQSGNKKYEGSIKVLKYEVDLLNDAAIVAGFADITEVPHNGISLTVEFKRQLSEKSRIIAVTGVAFTELGVSLEQNAKMTEITLPILALGIEHKTNPA